MDPHHAEWNRQQQYLQSALVDPGKHPQWLELFLCQHAQVHAGAIEGGTHSFVDDLLLGLGRESLRLIPERGEHSIAWILWHLARIEDIVTGFLIAETGQVFAGEDWKTRLGVGVSDTGNASDAEAVGSLSRSIHLEHLLDYRLSVGRRTRQVVQRLDASRLKEKVAPARLQAVHASGEVLDEAVLKYWGGRTIAGLLLMPLTRHCVLHLNEAGRIKASLVRYKASVI